MNELKLSIITPCYNESTNIADCVEQVRKSVLDFSNTMTFEHIFIDNASTDHSQDILQDISKKYSHVRILRNSQNVGVFSSIQRAISYTKGEWLIPFFAADLQDPPYVITEMLKIQLASGCDSVFGIRATRIESNFLLAMRKIFYKFLKIASSNDFVEGTSEFCLIKKEIAIAVTEIDDPNPFLRIYLSKLRGKVEYVKFQMEKRAKGKSSANLFTLTDDALNAFSIIMPSIFSRVLVFLFPISFLLLSLFLTSIPLVIFNFWSPFYSYSFAVAFILLIIMALQCLVGHYLFILHKHMRRPPMANTTEFF